MLTWLLSFDGSEGQLRRRLGDHFFIPRESGESNDLSHHLRHIPGKTNKNTIALIVDKLKRLGNFANLTPLRAEDARLIKEAALSLVNHTGNLDASLTNFENRAFLKEMEHAINGRIDERGKNDTEGPLSNPWAWMRNDERPLEDLFDVVILTGNITAGVTNFGEWNSFLEAWKPIIEKLNLIIIQQGDPSVEVPLPSWANYELYNKLDVARTLRQHAWIMDMDSNSTGARSFGVMVSDKEFVYFLDRNTLPAADATGALINPLVSHALQLMTPSLPYYFSATSDPFRKHSDFSRGYPSSLKEGIPTGLSVGRVAGSGNYDAVAKLLKPTEAEDHPLEETTTQHIPHGMLYSLSATNLAIHRGTAGNILFFYSSHLAQQEGYDVGDKNLEVIAGWVIKVVLDWVRVGTKSGGTGLVQSVPVKSALELAEAVANDVAFASAANASSEALVRFFADQELHGGRGKMWNNHDSASRALYELLDALEFRFAKMLPFIKRFCNAYRAYVSVYDDQHAFHPKTHFLPAASRASLGPPPDSPHKCAVVTIMHDEPKLLPVWARYYRRHFPGSVFIADHQRNYTNLPAEVRKAQEVDVKGLQGEGRAGLVRYMKLFGDQGGFPVHYFVGVAQLWMDRLLRKGYKCVMYTDIDEFIVVNNKTRYKRGLTDFLVDFVNDQHALHWRAVAFSLAHVSEAEAGAVPLEAPLNWSKPILQQRGYWSRVQRYDKPLLSKVPLRWRPGFHTTFPPPTIEHHMDLLLLHVPEIDKDFCVERETKKRAAMAIAHAWETNKGFNIHIASKAPIDRCRYARSLFVQSRNSVMDVLRKDMVGKMSAELADVEI